MAFSSFLATNSGSVRRRAKANQRSVHIRPEGAIQHLRCVATFADQISHDGNEFIGDLHERLVPMLRRGLVFGNRFFF